MKRNAFMVNFVAGGVGGTAGVFVTCPLDVVQTRLQSSVVTVKKLKPSTAQFLNPAVVGNGGTTTAVLDISSTHCPYRRICSIVQRTCTKFSWDCTKQSYLL